MASDDTKVRLNAETDAAEVSGKRPFHFVFVGDLGAGERLVGLTPLDKDDFAAVLKKAGVSAPVSIKNPLGGAGDWEFVLALDSIKAFDPEGLLRQIPAGRWRLGLREKLMQRQTGAISPADFQSALQAAATGDPTLAWA